MMPKKSVLPDQLLRKFKVSTCEPGEPRFIWYKPENPIPTVCPPPKMIEGQEAADKRGLTSSFRGQPETVVLTGNDLRAAMLEQFGRDLEDIECWYRTFKDLCVEVGSVRKKVAAKRAKVKAHHEDDANVVPMRRSQ